MPDTGEQSTKDVRERDVRARDVVYVVAKAPRAGQSKTRLCPPLLPEEAAQLAAAFLEDTIALAGRAGADVRLICRDEAERGALLDGHPQRPAVAGARSHGAAPVVPRDHRPIRRQHTLVSPRRAQLGSR